MQFCPRRHGVEQLHARPDNSRNIVPASAMTINKRQRLMCSPSFERPGHPTRGTRTAASARGYPAPMPWIENEPVRGGYPDIGFLGLPGNTRMRAGLDGYMLPPPIYHLMGLKIVEAGDGSSTFSMPASPWLAGNSGLFLAGVSALAADAPLGGAILSKVPAGVYGATSELSMNFMRPATVQSERLTARATVIETGRSLGLSHATVTDARNSVLAHATSRYFLTTLPEIPAVGDRVHVEPPVYATPDPHMRPLDDDPARDRWMSMSGLEYFQAVIKGDMPAAPFARLFGMTLQEAESGRVTASIPAVEWLCSPARTIYGGLIAFFADAMMTAAVGTTLPAGSSSATLDLKVQYLRPGFADGRALTCRGEVVHRGRTLAVARAEILNADGKALALATGSTMILEGRPWRAVAVADESAPED